jgi:RND family efflux transporter MFP subunit
MHTLRPLALAALITAVLASTSQAADSSSVAVTTAVPKRQEFSEAVTGYGSIQADPRAALALSLPQGSRIAQVLATPGARVTAGQVLLRVEPDGASRLTYVQAEHELQLAQASLDQTQTLYGQRLATQGQLDTARKTLADAVASLQTQQALGGGSAQRALKAPANGVIESIAVSRGERLAAGTTVLRFAPVEQLLARVGVEPGDAARVKPHQSVIVTPVFGGPVRQGRVSQIGNMIDPQSRLVEVLVSLPTASALPLGSEVAAQIESGSISAWAVPRSSVLSDDHGTYLFQIDHGAAHRVAVTLVHPDGDTVGVTGPLDPQQPVVALGAYELTDGLHVRTQQP